MDGIRTRKSDGDMTSYGNFYILGIVDIVGLEQYNFTLVAEDFSYVDCNGNTYDVPIAYAKDKNQLLIWAACNGIDISDTKVHTKIRQRIAFD